MMSTYIENSAATPPGNTLVEAAGLLFNMALLEEVLFWVVMALVIGAAILACFNDNSKGGLYRGD